MREQQIEPREGPSARREKIEKIQTNVIPLLKNESKMTDEEKKRVEQAGKGKQLPKWLQEKGQYEEEEE